MCVFVDEAHVDVLGRGYRELSKISRTAFMSLRCKAIISANRSGGGMRIGPRAQDLVCEIHRMSAKKLNFSREQVPEIFVASNAYLLGGDIRPSRYT